MVDVVVVVGTVAGGGGDDAGNERCCGVGCACETGRSGLRVGCDAIMGWKATIGADVTCGGAASNKIGVGRILQSRINESYRTIPFQISNR